MDYRPSPIGGNMAKSEKEIAFEAEYKALLEKYNVKLVVSPWGDEWGEHIDISFVERGKYRNINYCPEYEESARRHCGMGG
jgi:hypothetical protein